MNKEELIEYFIKILGDNNVLEKYFSIEEIRKCLIENIKIVTYESEKGLLYGHYDPEKKILNMDLSKCTSISKFNIYIVHEMLHALSFSLIQELNEIIYKIGFEINHKKEKIEFYCEDEWIYTKDKKMRTFGKSINEGITQILTEEILGINSREYLIEKAVTRVLFGIIGKDNILKKYFKKIKDKNEINNPIKYFFYDSLEKKYIITETNNGDYTIKFFLNKLVQSSDCLTVMVFNSEGNLERDQIDLYNKVNGTLQFLRECLLQKALETIKDKNDINRKNEILRGRTAFYTMVKVDNARINHNNGNNMISDR